jgi:hypothetical protein
MANKAAPYCAVQQRATLFYVTDENIIFLKHLMINHGKLFSLPVLIQGTRGLLGVELQIQNTLFANSKFENLYKTGSFGPVYVYF